MKKKESVRKTPWWQNALLLGAWAALFLGAALALEQTEFFKRSAKGMQRQDVATSALGMNTFRDQARDMQLFEIIPNPEADYSFDPEKAAAAPDARLASQRSRRGAVNYAVRGSLAPSEYPSAKILPQEEIEKGLPVLSLALDHSDLFDPRIGILSNPLEKGKKWERPGFLSYFDQGKLLVSTGLGVRVHGGKSRYSKQRSFRLRFRKRYGQDRLAAETFFPALKGDLKSLVLQNDMRYSHSLRAFGHFMAPLAYDITRIIGGQSPHTKPVRLFINKKFLGVYVLTERIDEDYAKLHFGHKDFTIASEKSEPGESRVRHGREKPYDRFSHWSKRGRQHTLGSVSERIDIKNFCLSLIATHYTAATDSYQAYSFLNEKQSTPKWFWVNWDMDHAFVDVYRAAKTPWQHPTMRHLLANTALHRQAPRFHLFRKLTKNDQAFRDYYRALFVEVMNHKLRPEVLQERVEYYIAEARRLGIKEHRFHAAYRNFVKNRHEQAFQHVAGRFSDGRIFPVQVHIPQGKKIFIDGYAWEGTYAGRYLPGMRMHIRSEETLDGEWFANGSALPMSKDKELDIEITGEMNIAYRAMK